jgi:hypothetical protein
MANIAAGISAPRERKAKFDRKSVTIVTGIRSPMLLPIIL